MSSWYSRRVAHGPVGFAALSYLRKLGRDIFGLGITDRFYRVAIDFETTDIVVFIAPGHDDLAIKFGACPCSEPEFGSRLRDVSVVPIQQNS
jgi:hypothetical protein